ncbi:MAG: hypothetical protein ACYTG7_22340, partial [Planctomycetota bacterium]
MDLQVFDNWVVKPPAEQEGKQKKTDRISKKIQINVQGNHNTIKGETLEISPGEFKIKITDDEFLMPEILASPDQCRAKIEQEFAYGIGVHFPNSDVSYKGRVSPERDSSDVTIITCVFDIAVEIDTFLALKSNGTVLGSQSASPDQNSGQGLVSYEAEVTGGRKAFKALALNLTESNVQIYVTDSELRMPEGPGKSVFINKIITDHFIKGMTIRFNSEITIKADPMGVNEVNLEGKPCTVIECSFRRELTQEELASIKSGSQNKGSAGGSPQPAQAAPSVEQAQPAAQSPAPPSPVLKEQEQQVSKEIPLVKPKALAQPAVQSAAPAPPMGEAQPAAQSAVPAPPPD